MMLFDTQTLLNPYPMFQELRVASPVLHVEALDFWLVFRYDDVKTALTDTETFSSENTLLTGFEAKSQKSMVMSDEPAHGRMRSIAQPAFTPRRVAKLEQRIRELCVEMLDQAAERGDAFDLVEAFSGTFPAIIIAELLGVPRQDIKQFQALAADLLLLANAELVERGKAAEKALAEYYADLLRERAASGVDAEDVTGDLLRAAAANPSSISHDEMIAMGVLFLVAGHETTTNLINNTVRCLSENPEAHALAVHDPSRVPLILEEVLRYRGPVLGVPRRAVKDTMLSGVRIPADSRILAMVASANRDPSAFEDPERFIATRSPQNILSFGRGIHKCLGEPLSRLEAKVAIPMLYERFPHLHVDPSRPIVPNQSPIINGYTSLPVRTCKS